MIAFTVSGWTCTASPLSKFQFNDHHHLEFQDPQLPQDSKSLNHLQENDQFVHLIKCSCANDCNPAIIEIIENHWNRWNHWNHWYFSVQPGSDPGIFSISSADISTITLVCCNFTIWYQPFPNLISTITLWLVAMQLPFDNVWMLQCSYSKKMQKKGPIYQSATISTSLPDLLALNDHVHQVGQPDSLVEYQHYMRINGYVWSATPVEGEVGQRLQFQQPFNVLLIWLRSGYPETGRGTTPGRMAGATTPGTLGRSTPTWWATV